ncbi:MAG: 2-hydroxyacyl-CoA dehydratase family protein [Thermodesulfobacteriota bacterium]
MQSDLLEPFYEAIKDQEQRLRNLAAEDRKIIGYFCTYTPVELIHASGFIPMRVMGGTRTLTKADSLAPSFVCPYLRAALDKALNGEYSFLSGIVQGYTCDAACGVVRIWERNIPGEIFHTLALPYCDSVHSRRFFHSEIDALNVKFRAIDGGFNEQSLADSIELYGKIRRLVLEFYKMRYDGRLAIPASEFLAVIQAGFVTPPEDYLGMLERLAGAAELAAAANRGGTRVLVSGSLVEDGKVLDLVEESGGLIVADDLCTGIRNFYPASGFGLHPIERVIDRYMNRAPCPCRSRVSDRLPFLEDLLERSKAQGVIFLFQKYCTPHLADHPSLVEHCKAKGIPSIATEMEETGVNEGQLRTRLEAFFEMLR